MSWIVLILLFSYTFNASPLPQSLSSSVISYVLTSKPPTPIIPIHSVYARPEDGTQMTPMTLDLRSQDQSQLMFYQSLGDCLFTPYCLKPEQSIAYFFESKAGKYKQIYTKDEKAHFKQLQYLYLENITLTHAIKAAPFYREAQHDFIYFPALKYWFSVEEGDKNLYEFVEIFPLPKTSTKPTIIPTCGEQPPPPLKGVAKLFAESNAILAFYLKSKAGLTPILININDARVSRGLTIPRAISRKNIYPLLDYQFLLQGFLPYHRTADTIRELPLSRMWGFLNNDNKFFGEIDLIKEYIRRPLRKAFFEYIFQELSSAFVPLDLFGMYSEQSAHHKRLSQYTIENKCFLISSFFQKMCMTTTHTLRIISSLENVMPVHRDLFSVQSISEMSKDGFIWLTQESTFEQLKNISISEVSMLMLVSNLYSSDTFFAIKALQDFRHQTVISALFFMYKRGGRIHIALNKFALLLNRICKHVKNKILLTHDITLVKQVVTYIASAYVEKHDPYYRGTRVTLPKISVSSRSIEEDTKFLKGIIHDLQSPKPSITKQTLRRILSRKRKCRKRRSSK